MQGWPAKPSRRSRTSNLENGYQEYTKQDIIEDVLRHGNVHMMEIRHGFGEHNRQRIHDGDALA